DSDGPSRLAQRRQGPPAARTAARVRARPGARCRDCAARLPRRGEPQPRRRPDRVSPASAAAGRPADDVAAGLAPGRRIAPGVSPGFTDGVSPGFTDGVSPGFTDGVSPGFTYVRGSGLHE